MLLKHETLGGYCINVGIDERPPNATPAGWPATTATRFVDFQPDTAVLCLAPGQLLNSYEVIVEGDTTPEPNEQIVMALESGVYPMPAIERRYADTPPEIATITPAFGSAAATRVYASTASRSAINAASHSEESRPRPSSGANSMNVIAPRHAAGNVDVSVVCPGGHCDSEERLTFTSPRRRYRVTRAVAP